MRTILIAAAGIAALAAPAAAQQSLPPAADVNTREEYTPIVQPKRPPMDPRDEEVVRSLPHPGEVEAMGDVLGRTVDAVLSVPVGPIVEAANPGRRMSRREREETLGDIARRDDPYYRERMRDQISVASAAASVLIEQMAVMAPVLRRTIEDAERRIEDAARGAPPLPDYDRDYQRDD